jgi:hypothetical protein
MKFSQRIFQSQIDLVGYAATRFVRSRHQILLACMPKSGSTFLSNAVGRIDGFRKTRLTTAYGRTEQEIDPLVALRRARHDYVAQHHVKYNENTESVINSFGITPVVLVRNIFDCVVSLRDHLRRESVATPMAWFDEHHLEMDDNDLEDMIVTLAMPWYIDFYVSWCRRKDALWLTYEEVKDDTPRAVEAILNHTGRPVSYDEIESSLHMAHAGADRLNKGTSGRGLELSERNKDIVRHYCSFYPHIDFSLIGVE